MWSPDPRSAGWRSALQLLGRKTMEVEILKEALYIARVKKPTLLSRSQFPEDIAHRESTLHHFNKPRVRSNGGNSSCP